MKPPDHYPEQHPTDQPDRLYMVRLPHDLPDQAIQMLGAAIISANGVFAEVTPEERASYTTSTEAVVKADAALSDRQNEELTEYVRNYQKLEKLVADMPKRKESPDAAEPYTDDEQEALKNQGFISAIGLVAFNRTPKLDVGIYAYSEQGFTHRLTFSHYSRDRKHELLSVETYLIGPGGGTVTEQDYVSTGTIFKSRVPDPARRQENSIDRRDFATLLIRLDPTSLTNRYDRIKERSWHRPDDTA